jgi:hypothetical protein
MADHFSDGECESEVGPDLVDDPRREGCGDTLEGTHQAEQLTLQWQRCTQDMLYMPIDSKVPRMIYI